MSRLLRALTLAVACAGAAGAFGQSVVDTTTIVSSPDDHDTYGPGEVIEFEVAFGEPVRLGGSTFEFRMGEGDTQTKVAARHHGDNLAQAGHYRYTVGRGQMDPDGIEYDEDALSGVRNREGDPVDANVEPTTGPLAMHKVNGGDDEIAPQPTDVEVSSQPARERGYAIDEVIEIAVHFDERVAVENPGSMDPVVRVTVGSTEVKAAYADGSDSETLVFHYKVRPDDEDVDGISVEQDALVGGVIKDLGGNALVDRTLPAYHFTDHRVDGVKPRVTAVRVTSDPGEDGTYVEGDEIEITVDFDEPAVPVHLPDLGVELDSFEGSSPSPPRVARLAAGAGTNSLVFRYRVQAEDFAPDGIGVADKLHDGTVEDGVGNTVADDYLLLLDDQPGHRVDARGADVMEVRMVSLAGDDNTYAEGDRIVVQVVYDEDVSVSGSPELLLTFGYEDGDFTPSGPNVRATLVRVLARVLEFEYVVQRGDAAEHIRVHEDALVGGTIVDEHGNDSRELPLETFEVGVDAVGPAVSGIEITSDAGSDDTYGLGDVIEVGLSFDEVVHVNRVAGATYFLHVGIGAHERRALFETGSGTRTLVFRYTVVEEDRDEDGISIADTDLDCLPNPDDCLVVDEFGNFASLDVVPSLPAQPRHRVDGRIDGVSLAILSTPSRGGTYGRGEHIDIAVQFRRPAYVSGSPVLRVLVGEAERLAAYRGGSGTTSLAFRYTVAGGDYDDDGISVGPGPRALEEGVIEDADGNPVNRVFAPLPPNTGHRVDAVAPGTVSSRIVSSPADGEAYGLGEVIGVEVRFNETVHVTQTESALDLILAIGRHSRRAHLAEGSGTDTLLFEYAVTADDYDEDGVSVGPDALVGGVIEDIAGNEWGEQERRIPPVAPRPEHRVSPVGDEIVTTVDRVEIVSKPAGEAYGIFETIDVEVSFSETVHVSGSPTLEIFVGPVSRFAALATGSGSDTLVFSYAVQAGDVDEDGVSIGPGSAALQGGSIADAAGNPAQRYFAGLPADPAHRVDAVPATVAGLEFASDAGDDGTYTAGETIEVRVSFSEPVHVGGEPRLALNIGPDVRQAAFASGSGTEHLAFRYTVAEGDYDDDGVSIAANSLTGGTLTDEAGNAVERTFEARPADPMHRVDAVPAAVAGLEFASDAGDDGTYTAGETIEVRVSFSEPVHVGGEPRLALNIGPDVRQAAFASGSGTEHLAFRYTVAEGDYDDDGVSIAANSLTGGTLTDEAGNAVERTFEARPADPMHRVDAVPAAVAGLEFASDAGDDGTYTAGETIEVRVSFSEPVHVGGEPRLALNIGPDVRQAAFASGSGTEHLAFRYTVAEGDYDDDGVSIAANSLTGGTLTDEAGNAVERTFEARPADPMHRVDAVPAAVAGLEFASDAGDDGTYTAGETIEVRVSFSEPVHVGGEPRLALNIGPDVRQAAFASGSGTEHLAFRYTVAEGDYDDDGVSIAANSLTGGTLTDEAGNAVERTFEARPADPMHRVDAVPAAVAGLEFASDAGDDGTYTAGETIEVRVSFSEPVHVGGEPRLALNIGPDVRQAAFASGSGTEHLAFRYTVAEGDYDDDGVSIAANSLTGGTLTDEAGNAVERTFEARPADPMHRVDAVPAAVAGLEFASDAGDDGTYTAGETIEVRVSFSEPVHVGGEPRLALNIGPDVRQAAFASGSGTEHLAFRYTVAEGDYDDDGVSIAANSLTGGTLTDEAGNAVERTFEARPADPMHRVDAVPAAVAGLEFASDAGDDGTYTAGETIEVRVSFSEPVHVGGEPRLALNIGPDVRQAAFASGSGTEHLAFRYTVAEGDYDDDGVSIAANSLTGGTLTDEAGNAVERTFEARPADPMHRVDAVPAAVAGLEFASDAGDDGTYTAGETIEVRVSFSEPVHVGGEPRLALNIGPDVRQAAFASGSGTEHLAFRYTVAEGDYDDDGVSIAANSLTGGTLTDEAGNAVERTFEARPADPMHRVDAVPAAVAGLEFASDAGDDGTYTAGETIEVRVSFSEPVHVGGEPRLALNIGPDVRQAAFASGSGTEHLAFRYTVAEGDYDDDGVSIAANSLTGGTLTDEAGNAVERTFEARPADPMHRVDAVPAAVAGLEFASDAGDDGTYTAGETIEVRVSFSEPVHVGGEPRLALNIGPDVRQAAFASGSGTEHLAFRYTVAEGDYDDDGVSIAANSLTGGTLTDEAGNAVERTFEARPADPMHRVDAVPAAVAGLEFASDAGDDGTYTAGETIEVRVSFSEPVHVGGEPRLALNIGPDVRQAAFASGSGTEHLAFRYTVAEGDYDDDGVSIAANSLTGGTLTDEAGNAVERTFEARPADPMHRVDAVPAAVAGLEFASDAGDDGTYTAGETIEVRVSFSEPVHVGGEPRLALNIGPDVRQAAFASGSGTEHLAFRYTVAEGDYDDDGVSIAANSLTGGTLTDEAGNAVERTFEARPADPMHRVDAVPATVAGLEFASDAGDDGTYTAGETIEVRVSFSEPVHVGGAPRLALNIGPDVRQAAFASGSGTEHLAFRYTVAEGDYDDDGVSIAANSLTGGTLTDEAGNAVERTFEARPADPMHRVDAVPATVAGLEFASDAGGDGTYTAGETIEVRVSFSEPVHVGGAPRLALNIGPDVRQAAFASGSGTERLAFRYTVAEGDYDDDGVSIAANSLTGGTLTDEAGNAVERTFEARPADPMHRVDAVPATVAGLEFASDAGGDGTYTAGETIEVRVSFSEPVHVGGAPRLALNIGPDVRQAAFASGSGTERLAFRYTVAEGDYDDDGVSIAANSLTGGTLTDEAGNAVERTFEARPADPMHRVDAVPATVAGLEFASDAGDDGTYTAGETIEVRVSFSEPVHVGGAPRLALNIGPDVRQAAFASGSGTERLAFRYTVAEGDYDDDGVSIAANSLTGGTLTDEAGNAVERTFEARPADPMHSVDAVPATVAGLEFASDAGDDGTYTAGETIEVRVSFSEPVHVGGAPRLALNIGPDVRQAAFASGSGTERLAFRYTVAEGDYDDDGVSIAANTLTGGTLTDDAGNAVDRTFEAVGPDPGHRVGADVVLLLAPVTVRIGRTETLDLAALLAARGITYGGAYRTSSEDPSVARGEVAGGVLTIVPESEGQTTILIVAASAALTLGIPVTVEASVAETAVLQHALSAIARGLLASTASVVTARLEAAPAGAAAYRSGSRGGRPGLDRAWPGSGSMAPVGGGGMLPGEPRTPFGEDRWNLSPASEPGTGLPEGTGRMRSGSFALPFGGIANPAESWGMWAAADVHSFEGDPERGRYDGSMGSVHLGIDALGERWTAGGSVSHSWADASYAFEGDGDGEGTLETRITALHPYVAWSPDEGTRAWVVLGFGSGEAGARRGGSVQGTPADLSMRLGMAGLRWNVGRVRGFTLAARADAGFASLETGPGIRAVEALEAEVQRLRAGVEGSMPMQMLAGDLTPFVHLSGRYDSGDGETGGGIEIVGGVRYRNSIVGAEAQARILVLHGGDGYAEQGVSATVFVEPTGPTGLRLSLSPRRGFADPTDAFWARNYRPGALHGGAARARAWSLDGRVGYGFHRGMGVLTPFGEVDVSGGSGRRTRVGMSYAALAVPASLEVSVERAEASLRSPEYRYLVSWRRTF